MYNIVLFVLSEHQNESYIKKKIMIFETCIHIYFVLYWIHTYLTLLYHQDENNKYKNSNINICAIK